MKVRAYVGWFAAGVPVALVLMIASPPLLFLLAIGLSVGPIARAEHLGLLQSIALPVLLVGVLHVNDRGADPIPWLSAGVIIAMLSLARYKHEARRGPWSSWAIAERVAPGTHETITAITLAGAAYVVRGFDDNSQAYAFEGILADGLVIAALGVAAAALIPMRPGRRAVMLALSAAAFGVAAFAVSFYFVPCALVLAAAVGRVRTRTIGGSADSV